MFIYQIKKMAEKKINQYDSSNDDVLLTSLFNLDPIDVVVSSLSNERIQSLLKRYLFEMTGQFDKKECAYAFSSRSLNERMMKSAEKGHIGFCKLFISLGANDWDSGLGGACGVVIAI
jgi:hypothetical protein